MRAKVLTRKKKTIRYLLISLVVLLSFNYLHGAFFLLPGQAVWETEQSYGCGRTERVKWFRAKETDLLACFSANEHAVLLSVLQPSWMGWLPRDSKVVDCSGEEDLLYGAVWQIEPGNIIMSKRFEFSQEHRPSTFVAFGRVEDPRIASVRFSYRYAVLDDPDWTEETLDWVGCEYTTEERDWYSLDDQRCFLLRSEPQGQGYFQTTYRDAVLTAFDAAGNVVGEKVIA